MKLLAEVLELYHATPGGTYREEQLATALIVYCERLRAISQSNFTPTQRRQRSLDADRALADVLERRAGENGGAP